MVGKNKKDLAAGLLTRNEINALRSNPLKARLIITPLLEESQIGQSSVDLRLGHEFVLAKRANMPPVDPIRQPSDHQRERYQERIRVPRQEKVFLHPGEFILGSTLEYIRLPNDIGAYVTSRSSWGRVGLAIATAIAVAPGFAGIITLELTNLGSAPLILRPGVRIAQILFHRCATAVEPYSGRYRCPTNPEPGKIHLDSELPFWCD